MKKQSFFGPDQVKFILEVETAEDGMRLDQFLLEHFQTLSRQKIKSKILTGEVVISKRTPPHKPSVKVHEHDVITIVTYNKEKEFLETDVTIIFEDDDIIIIDKPPGMLVHPTGKHLFHCATSIFEKSRGHTIHSIHRLDRETSGVLILGKTSQASTIYSQLFEDRKVKKAYLFLAFNNTHKHQTSFPFIANEALGMDQEQGMRMFVHAYPAGDIRGKSAATRFDSIIQNDKFILGLAFPETGRQHQIRAHAYHHGFALVGDKIYGHDLGIFDRFKDESLTEEDKSSLVLSRHALHAIALYSDEFTSEKKFFQTTIPENFMNFITQHFTLISPNSIKSLIDHKVTSAFLNT